jgi:hypothetical protein
MFGVVLDAPPNVRRAERGTALVCARTSDFATDLLEQACSRRGQARASARSTVNVWLRNSQLRDNPRSRCAKRRVGCCWIWLRFHARYRLEPRP